jgi:hypothetical protein
MGTRQRAHSSVEIARSVSNAFEGGGRALLRGVSRDFNVELTEQRSLLDKGLALAAALCVVQAES